MPVPDLLTSAAASAALAPGGLAVVVLTLNEEARLPRFFAGMAALRAAMHEAKAGPLHVLVLDAMSADGTAALARSYGAVVHSLPWSGFAAQRNKGLALAQSQTAAKWVLMLDADEVPNAELCQAIAQAVARPGEGSTAYYIRLRLVHRGRTLRFTGLTNDRHLLLFKAGGVSFEGIIHERPVLPPGTLLAELPGYALHYSYRSHADHLRRALRYESLRAAQDLAKGRNYGFFDYLAKPLTTFLRHAVWKGGLLEGRTGLGIALVSAQGVRHRLRTYARLKQGRAGRQGNGGKAGSPEAQL